SAPTTWSYARMCSKPSSSTRSPYARTAPTSGPISVCGNTTPICMQWVYTPMATSRASWEQPVRRPLQREVRDADEASQREEQEAVRGPEGEGHVEGTGGEDRQLAR